MTVRIFACVLALGMGCEQPATASTDPPAPEPFLCPAWQVSTSGVVTSDVIAETSGMVSSRQHDGVLWVHNDSGDGPRLYALSTAGALKGVLLLNGATAFDWEDLAIGPGPSDASYLYVGDIGDNAAVRQFVTVYRVQEPTAVTGSVAQPAEGAATALTFAYPDGAHNAELLWVDPRSGDLFIMSKDGTGVSTLYRAAAPHASTAEPRVLEVSTQLTFGQPPLGGARLVTGGDISADGSMLLVRTYTSAFVWHRPDDKDVPNALAGEPCVVPSPPSEPQGEAVGFASEGWSWYSLSEGIGQNLHRVDVVNP